MTFRDRFFQLTKIYWESHKRAGERLDALDKSGVTQGKRLGASSRMAFLAMADHQVDVAMLSDDEVERRVNALYKGAVPLAATKRQAIFKIGELVCHLNRFGVGGFCTPSSIFPDSESGHVSEHFLPTFNAALFSSFGIEKELSPCGQDPLYDYSPLMPIIKKTGGCS